MRPMLRTVFTILVFAVAVALSSSASVATISTWSASPTFITKGYPAAAETFVAPGNELLSYEVGFATKLAPGKATLSIYEWSGNDPVGAPLWSSNNLTWINGAGYLASGIDLVLTKGELYGAVLDFGGFTGKSVKFAAGTYSQGQAEWLTTGGWDPLYPHNTVNLQFTAQFQNTVPEPSSLLMLGSGALVLAGVLRRRFAR